jgi:hypothetical protein
MGDHPPPPDILRANPVASLPELQHDKRRADFFVRVQFEMCQFLARPKMNAAIRVAREFGGPLARPADDDDQPFLLAPLQIEVG